MKAIRELSVGFSRYWVEITEHEGTWCASWRQDGRVQTAHASSRDAALVEARLLARRIEAATAVVST